MHRGDACPLELPSVDEDEVDEEEPGLPSMAEVLERRRQAFIERFGREPQGNDPIFFDPSAATPQPMNDEVVEQLTLEAMHKAKLHPAFIHAYRKTGRILAEPGVKNLSPEELQEWQDAIDEWYATHPDADPETKEPEVPDDLLGILANPINAGVSPYYPRLVSDEQWVSVAMKLASGRDPDVTPEQFFRTLLQELRKGLTYAADQNLQRVDRETRE